MAFHPLKDLLPAHLKRAGLWSNIQRQNLLEQAQEICFREFPSSFHEHIQCTSVKDGVLTIHVSSSSFASEVQMKEKTLLEEFSKASLPVSRVVIHT